VASSDPIFFESPAELRDWLDANHETADELFVGAWKKSTGKPTVTWPEIVEEALCVGWIDSVAGRLDEQRGLQWFSPRRSTSGWARTNKARVERLIAAGLMLPAGLDAIDEAKRNGSWTRLDDVENLVVPDDLAAALAAQPGARKQWDSFSRSPRRAILEWIAQAKRAETRARRVAEAAEHAARGERPPQFRPRDESRR